MLSSLRLQVIKLSKVETRRIKKISLQSQVLNWYYYVVDNSNRKVAKIGSNRSNEIDAMEKDHLVSY